MRDQNALKKKIGLEGALSKRWGLKCTLKKRRWSLKAHYLKDEGSKAHSKEICR
jgi:hypothetical protein